MSTQEPITQVKAARLADLGKRTDTVRLSPQIISIETGHNPRDYRLPENRAHLDELKASIKANGVLVPLLVRFDVTTGIVYLVDGECRLTACLELIEAGTPIDSVPTVQVKAGNEAERLIIAMTANTGKPLSKWESGGGFQRLIGYGWDEAKIAQRLGYSLRFIKEALELADAPEAVKHLLSEQAVTPSLALAELRTKPADEAIASMRQKVVEARANGQKTARKEQENRVPTSEQLLKLISALVESVQDELFGEDSERFVEVDKNTMRKLAKAVGIEPRG